MIWFEVNGLRNQSRRRNGEGMLMNTPEEVTLLSLLASGVPRTLEDLVQLSDLSPAQVLLAVDRLSRSGHIVLRKDGMDYHVTRSAAA